MKQGEACQGKYWGQRRFNLTNEYKRSRLVFNAYEGPPGGQEDDDEHLGSVSH